jgi:transposase
VSKSWDRHDRLSVTSAITTSPRRQKLALYWRLQSANVCGLDVARFLRQLRRATGRRLLIILDRLNAHRTAARLLDADVFDRSPESPYRVAWLPGYAPELNPVEHVWGHTKHDDLANYIPENLEALAANIDTSLGHTSTEQALLRGFFRFAQLRL